MDTAAYLANQGWRGDGHALHHSGRGITKPILTSKKSNVFGIGKKKHDAHADQWWARAFDVTLKGINATTNSATGKTEGISLGAGAQALQMVGTARAKWAGQSGLYSNFVQGELLSGTLTPEEEMRLKGDKQKRGDGADERKKLVPPRPCDTRKRKRGRHDREKAAEGLVTLASETTVSDVKQAAEERKHGHLSDQPTKTETKTERRQRRRERREKKALQKRSSGQEPPCQSGMDVTSASLQKSERYKKRETEKLPSKTLPMLGGVDDVPDYTTKAFRRKDRKAKAP